MDKLTGNKVNVGNLKIPSKTIVLFENLLTRLFIPLLLSLFSFQTNAQVGACSPNSPIIEVNLSSNPDSVWTLDNVNRTLKNCCGRPNNEPCVKFRVTLHPDADGIVFSITDGATPPIIEWQLMDEANTECEAPAKPADELVCLDGVGPFYVVFCKPGNNANEYQITSVQETEVSDAVTVSEGCQDTLVATGYDEATIVWTSVYPGARGDYDSYLSCGSACDTVIVSASPGYPPYIDFELSGSPAAGCVSSSSVDTVRVYFVSTLSVAIEPPDPAICFGGTGVGLTAVGSGGAAPYTYLWSTGETTQSIIATSVGDYWVQVEDTTNCGAVYDTVNVTKFLSPITAEAGPSQTVCENSPTITLAGVVTEATGGGWTGGNGVFLPDTADLGATYTPTAAEISAGSVTLTLTTTGNRNCPASTDFMVLTINPMEDPGFSYAATSYCQGDADPLPTITGVGGGTFSAPGSVVINPSTGSIDLSASTVGGPYTITYTTPGTCSSNTTFNVTILAEEDPAFTYSAISFCQGDVNPTPTITGVGGGTFSAPAAVTINAGTGEIDLASSTIGGPYVITYSTPGTCSNSTTFSISIVGEDDPTFSYGAPSYCQAGADPSPTISGTPGGTFSAPAGLSINFSTGVIDASASTAGGPYTITYTTAGTCPNSSTFDVTIVLDDPTFSYGAPSYCQGDANPIPVVTGTPGGTFSAPGGVVINAGTGEIDLAASTVGGPYAVNYSTGPSCPIGSNFNVSIIAEDDPSFGYSAANYCQGDVNPTPTITGTSGGTFSAPAAVSINASTGEINLAASTTGGPYTITYTTSGTCPNSTTFDVTIDAEDDPTFSYTAASYCQADVNPIPTITGTPGGTFSAPAGVVINAGTGEIDLAASAIGGPYNITYTTLGVCPNSFVFAVSIVAEDDPTFSYSSITFCQGESNPAPTITGTPGGTFSAPVGVSINSGTGIINLAASTAGGPYTITYTTAGTCANSSTFDITIIAVDDPAFSYASATFCQSGTNPTPTITGLPGGTFSESSGNIVFISTATGEIDLAASTLGGPYDIKYLTNGVCPDSLIVAVTITSGFDASFSYAGSPFCEMGANPSPTFTTGSPGTFTVTPAGLNFVNVNTGKINLSTSNPGSYRIHNTIPAAGGCAAAIDSFDIVITPIDDPSFTYSAASFCQADGNQLPTITGTIGGSFAATAGLSIIPATGEIDLASSTVGGPYTITYTTSGSCPDNTTFDVSVLAEDDPSFTYPSISYCQGDADPSPTITGTLGGTFSAPAGVTINAGTGVIDLSTSTAGGPYSISYTTPGTCSNSTTFDITIVAEDNPAFNFATSTFCQGGINPLPTISGTPGGTFSAAAGLSIDAGSGEINLSTSTAGGPYSVTYTTSGTCPNSSVVNVTILDSIIVNAGLDQTVCYHAANVNLSGTVPFTGIWTTSGGGSFSPNDSLMTATYIPVLADSTAGSVTLTLTSTNNGSCAAASDFLEVTINPGIYVNAGNNQTACQDTSGIVLTGTVDGATGGIWTTNGAGSFSPNETTLITSYIPAASDATLDSVMFVLTSTGNGLCLPVTDVTYITITPAPVVNAGSDLSACSTNPVFSLNGSVSGGSSTGKWTTSGSGTFAPNDSTLTATYTASDADTTAGSVTIYLTSTNNGLCSEVVDSALLTITSGITLDPGSSSTLCSNNSDVVLNGTISGATSTGLWSTSGSGSFSPNDSTLNATYISSPADTATGSIYLVLTSTNNGGCLTEKDSILIDYTPSPAVSAGADQAVCANNANTNLVGTIAGGASQGLWNSSGTGAFSPSAISLNTAYVPSAADTVSGSIIITLTSTDNGNCLAVIDSMTITIEPTPQIDAGSDIIACNDDTPQLNGNVTGGMGTAQWSTLGTGSFTPDNVTLNANYVPGSADTLSGSVQLVLTTTNNQGCLPISDTVEILFTPRPVVAIDSLDASVCGNNANINIYGSVSGSSTTGIWSTSGSGTFSPSDTVLTATYVPSDADIAAGSVLLTLSSTYSCLVIDTATALITPGPQVDANVDQYICVGDMDVLLDGSVSGTTTEGVWTTTGSGTFAPNDSTLNATYNLSAADSIAGSFDLILTSINNGACNANTDTLTVLITTIPVVNAGLDDTICSNALATLSGTVTGGSSTGVWSTSGTGIFLPDSTDLNASYQASAADEIAGTVQLILSSTMACVVDTDTLDLVVTPSPVSDAGTDIAVCSNNADVSLNGTVAGITTTGRWSTLGSGTFVPNDSTLNATYIPTAADIASGSLNIFLSSTNNGFCNPDVDTVLITFGDPPVVDAGTDPIICIGDSSAFLNGSVSGVTTMGRWTSSGTGYFSPNDSTLNAQYVLSTADSIAGSITLILTSINNGGCNANSDTITITTTTIPVVNAGFDAVACANTQIVLIGSVSGGTTTGVWSTSGSGTFSDSSSLNPVYSFGATESASGSVQLVLTSTGACVDITDTVDIIVTPSPVVNAGSDLVVCYNNSTVALSGSVSVATTTGIWSTSGTGGFVPNDSTLTTNYVPSIADKDAGSLQFTLTSTNNGDCNAEFDLLNVTISPSPVVDAGEDQIICMNDSASLNGSVSLGATTGTWTTSGTGTFLPNANTLTAIYAPSPADTVAGAVILTLTSTNNGSCIAESDQMNLSIVTRPNVDAGIDQLLCANNGDAAISGLVSGTTTTGIWSTTGTGTFTPSDTSLNATYVSSAEDGNSGLTQLILNATNSCNYSDTLDIVYTPSPVVDAGADPFVCIYNPTVNLVGNVSGGASTGIWSTLGTGAFVPNDSTLTADYNPSVADSAAGTVILVLTSTNNGDCLAETDSLLVSIVPPPIVNAGINDTVCANVPVQLNGQITIGATEGVWTSSGTGYFVPDSTDLNALYVISSDDSLAGSIYFTLTPTNFSGCPVTTDTMETIITPAPYADGGLDMTVCENNDTVYVVGQIFGPTSTGIWETFGSGVFLEDDSILINRYVPSQADIDNELVVLSLSTTNNGNCYAETYLTLITITPAPEINAGEDLIVCNDDVVPLEATISGGATGAYWTSTGSGTFTPNDSTLSPIYQPSSADTIAGGVTFYATTIDTSNCISVTDTLFVQFTPRPIVIAGLNDTVCANNSNVFLNGNVSGSTTTGIWSTNGTGTFVPSDTVLNATYVPGTEDSLAGFVTLLLSSTNACLVSDSLTVLITPAPVVNTGGNQILCEGDTTAVLNASVTGGSTTGIWTTSGTGYFTPNDSTLTATYILSAADTTNRNVTLYLESTNNGDCFSVIDSLEITITSIPVVYAGIDDTTCSNTSIALNGTVTGGAGLGVWSSLGGGTFADSSDLSTNFINPPAGTVQVVLTSVDACLEISDTVEFEVLPAPELSITLAAPVCIDNRNLDLIGTVANAGGVQWSNLGTGFYTSDDTLLTTSFYADAADSLTGYVTIILTSTDNGRCNAVTISEDIYFSDFPIADAGEDQVICTQGSLNASLSGTITGGSSTGIWSTSGTGSFFPNNTSLSASYVPSSPDTSAGNVYLILTSTNNGSCSPSSDSVQIVWQDPPLITITSNDTVCLNELPVVLDVSIIGDAGNYLWTTSGTGSFLPSDTSINASYDPSATDMSNGSVQLAFSSVACPSFVDSLNLVFIPSPVAGFSYTTTCNSLEVSFTDSSSISSGSIVDWNWDFGDGIDSTQNPTHVFATFGSEPTILVVESDKGCRDTLTQNITRSSVVATISYSGECLSDPVSFIDSSVVVGDSVVSWLWNFGDGNTSTSQNPSYTYPNENDLYVATLIITTSGGCSDSDSASIGGGCNETTPAVPSGFTPNGDNNNDILYVDGGPFSELDFRIYNEWGELIFQSVDQASGWDGTKNEIDQPLGVYVYTLKATTLDGVEHELTGNVTLIR